MSSFPFKLLFQSSIPRHLFNKNPLIACSRFYSVAAINESFESKRKELMEAIVKERIEKRDLRKLAYHIQSHEDAESFSTIYEQWQRKQLPFNCMADGSIIMDMMLNVGAKQVLFGCLANQYLYKLMPTRKHLDLLMDQYIQVYYDAIDNKLPQDQVIQSLDDVFKCFTLYVYYDIVPDKNVYEKLVLAGRSCPYEEGFKRALVTAQEQAFLGIPMTLDTQCIRIHTLTASVVVEEQELDRHGAPFKQLKRAVKELGDTLSKEVNPPLSYYGLLIKACLAIDNYRGAVKYLEQAVKHEETAGQGRPAVVPQYQQWPRIEDVVVECVEKVKKFHEQREIEKRKTQETVTLQVKENAQEIASIQSKKSNQDGETTKVQENEKEEEQVTDKSTVDDTLLLRVKVICSHSAEKNGIGSKAIDLL